MDKKIILYDSHGAAIHRTMLSGWVSSNGRFFGEDEHLARYDGCTHRKCSLCKNLVEKSRTMCSDCNEKRQVAKYAKKEVKKWDGATPLYSEVADEFYFDEEGFEDLLPDWIERHVNPRLVLCESVFLHRVDEDYWIDALPEDGVVPPNVEKALNALNKEIDNTDPVSWSPGRYAVSVEDIK